MKEAKTTPGKSYSVHTMNGCTIIEPDGWQKTIEAPDGYFDAHFGSVVIEGDDEASIKPLFKLAPQQRLAILGVLGGGTPAWLKALEAELTALLDGSAFELAWLAKENTLVVHTDRVDDAMLDAVKNTAEAAMPATATLVQYNHNIDISWRNINKYANIKTLNELSNFTTKEAFQSDLTSDGWWVYPLSNLSELIHGHNDGVHRWFQNNPKLKGVDFYLPKGRTGYLVFSGDTNLEEAHLYVGDSHSQGSSMFVGDTKLKKVTGYINGCFFNTMCNGCKLLSDFDLEISPVKLAQGYLFEGMFNGCILNKESVLRFINRLPSSSDAYNGSNTKITLGIHVDHKTDEEVLATISAAEEAGWTLTVQWNGTPTSTASTLSFGSLIYAKVGETERPDGTTEQYLDWGHYVTDWEARGYEQFRSLASAYRYFELPMPEDLTNN